MQLQLKHCSPNFAKYLLLLILLPTALFAASVSVSWQPNTESDLAGYKIYYGGQTGSYSTTINVANVQQYSVTGLSEGSTYYFAVTAYDQSGNESSYSTEVPITVSDKTLPKLVRIEIIEADQVRLTFSEPIEKNSAEIESNYKIDNGSVVVQEAVLQSDNVTVLLTTTQHGEGSHTLVINNIRDRATVPNTIVANTSGTYTFSLTDTDGPKLLSASVARGEQNDFITVVFNEPVGQQEAYNPDNYEFYPAMTIQGVGLSSNQMSVSLTTGFHTPGQMYTLTVRKVKDAVGNVINSSYSTTTYQYKATDASAPVLLAARIVSATRLELDFNEKLDPTSSVNSSNYLFSPSVAITSAALSIDQMTVILTTTPHSGVEYTITAKNIADQATPKNVSGNQSMKYTYVPPDIVAPTLMGTPQLIEANLLSVTFSEMVERVSAETAANYKITLNGTSITVYSANLLSGEKTVYLTTDQHTKGSFTLTVNNVKDIAGNTILSNSQKSYTYDPPDKEKPKLLSAVLHGADVLDLRFNESLERISAETVANFSISPSITIQSASLVGDSLNHVYLRTANHQTGIPYTVTVNNVKDQATVPNTILANTQGKYSLSQNDTEPPRLIGATLKGDRFLELTFSETLYETEAQKASNYQITVSGSVVSVLEAQLDLTLKKVYLTTGAHDVGIPYTVTVFNVKDRATPANVIGSENNKTYQLPSQDVQAPFVKSVDIYSDDLLEIEFSEPVDPVSATNPDNYVLKNATGTNVPTKNRVRMSYSPNVVRLETSAHQQGKYQVVIRNISDLAKIPNTMKEETWSYTYTPPDVDAPQFVQLSILADNLLQIEFNEALESQSARNTSNYTISSDNGDIQVTAAFLDESLKKVILQTDKYIPGDYQIRVVGLKDQYGNEIKSAIERSYLYQVNDTERPEIIAAELKNDHQLVLIFNESLDATSAQTAKNYGINNNITVNGAVLNSTSSQVVLETSQHIAGTYTITVNGVKDASTNRNEIAPYSQFTYQWNPLDTIAPALISAQLFTNYGLELLFSEAINADDANNAENYVIDPPVDIIKASLQSESNRVWLITAPHDPGLYSVTVRNIHDRAFTPNLIGDKNQQQYRWTSPDTSAPKPILAELKTPYSIELIFDEEISSTSAQTLSNYKITPNVQITGAHLFEGRKIVSLETAMHSSRMKYQIEVKNIQDRAAVANTMKTPITLNYSMEDADTAAPWIVQAKLQGSTQLEILFSEKVEKTSAETRGNYTIRTGVEVKNAILDTASMKTVILETTMHLPGMNYEINVKNVRDQATVPNAVDASKWFTYHLNLTSPMTDNSPPQVARVDAISPSRIDVLFTEPVDQASAENVANYAIQDSVTILSAQLDSNLVRVHLVTSHHTEGSAYTIAVKNIRDRATKPNQLTTGYPIQYIISGNVSASQLSRGDYTFDQFGVGRILYADRDYTITQAPENLAGAIHILSCNDDKTDTSAAFLHFEVLGDAQIIVGYDRNSQSIPVWMKDWKAVGDQVISSNATVYNLYSKSVQSGRVTLGGNGGTLDDNMCIIFIKPMRANTSLLTHLNKASYELAHVEVGDPYYVDRDYKVASLPDSLESLLWIKTANDDKTSKDAEFLTFTLKLKSRVHVAYDTRISTLPSWMSDWESSGEEIVDSRGSRFEVFCKEYPAGEVTLGGNNGSADDNMYLVLVKPLEKEEDETQVQLPGYFTLEQNYPNPFNPSTTIEYKVHKAGHMTLTIYNILGQRVRVLVDRKFNAYEAGRLFAETWDGTDESGQRVASGVYIYRIQQDHFAKTKRMLLIK